MIEFKTPRGLIVNVPEYQEEDVSLKFNISDNDSISKYYENNGYVIVKDLFSKSKMDNAISLWEKEIKPFSGFIYRQATAKAETHIFDNHGWVMNPILNLQSLDPVYFRNFRNFITNNILASTEMHDAFNLLLDDQPHIVQSMYFEGNSATWEHQDSYYLDSEVSGEMAAAWVAVEDISARAGRFFICPGSHKIKLQDHGLYNNKAENHEVYIKNVVNTIVDQKLEIRAPILNKGDVLFWNSWTIHGSLDSNDDLNSRSSITCHAIPGSRKFLQLQTRVLNLESEIINNTKISRPKDLSKIKNKFIFFIETKFPKIFYFLKKQAILFYIKKNNRK